jgi:uncharacterized protein DUF6487
MSASSRVCPKCNNKMEQGFVMELTSGPRLVTHWAPGPPQKSFWSGTKMPDEGLVPIGTFRCSSCGFLESFAMPEFSAK